MHSIKEIFKRQRQSLEVVAISRNTISLACEEAAYVETLIPDLETLGAVQISKDQALISCVGEGLQQSVSETQAVRRLTVDIDKSLAWQSTSSLNLISMVRAASVGPIIRQVHDALFVAIMDDRAVAES